VIFCLGGFSAIGSNGTSSGSFAIGNCGSSGGPGPGGG
jgi:hypothetical protein